MIINNFFIVLQIINKLVYVEIFKPEYGRESNISSEKSKQMLNNILISSITHGKMSFISGSIFISTGSSLTSIILTIIHLELYLLLI